mmetsp:Transcript_39521/g.60336  ORF Transcript_39521/g.60336 Transcript_39521/m.60336 type:complete len:95 (-) Transcript_39521:795-1079(-)
MMAPKQVFSFKEGISTDDEMHEWLCQEQTIRLPVGSFQYRFFLIPKFKDGKGIVVFKMHHSIGDGLGLVHLFLHLSGYREMKGLIPGMKPLPWW